MEHGLIPGHSVQLLVGARALFPAMIAAIAQARQSVWLETYILNPLGQAQQLIDALTQAALRGVEVQVLVDGVGTGVLPSAVAQRWQAAGVNWQVFSPLGRLGLLVPSRWRRLHRKLCVVDGAVAFCGGINVLDDWIDIDGSRLEVPRLDFAVGVSGPLVNEVCASMQRVWWRAEIGQRLRQTDWGGALHSAWAGQPDQAPRGDPHGNGMSVLARFIERDNVSHRARIERSYLRAIYRARTEVLLAHAYFVPGRRLRHALRAAVARGVRVRVLLQSRYENFMQYHAAQPVHHALMRAGVELYAYQSTALHAKVAVVDAAWATVGSSNLDPLSLLLAREANVELLDAQFAAQLQRKLDALIDHESVRLDPQKLAQRAWHVRGRDALAFVLMRLALFLTGKRY